MPDKSRSVRHQRIMDLLDNALETSFETGFMAIGRPDSCIRCGLAVDDADASWCEACHPKHGESAPASAPVPGWWVRAPVPSTMTPETVDALMRLQIERMADTFPSPGRRHPSLRNIPSGFGDTLRYVPEAAVIDNRRWDFSGLRNNALAQRWATIALPWQVTQLEVRQFSMDWRRAFDGTNIRAGDAWAGIDQINPDQWGWTRMIVTHVVRGAEHWPGMPDCRHDPLQPVMARHLWTGATPVAVIQAFWDDETLPESPLACHNQPDDGWVLP